MLIASFQHQELSDCVSNCKARDNRGGRQGICLAVEAIYQGRFLVNHFKASISSLSTFQREKNNLAAKYGIEAKLNELDQLVQEADERSGSKDDLKDVWRCVQTE
jgi:hypothetical protein